jgi:hypothetical protein
MLLIRQPVFAFLEAQETCRTQEYSRKDLEMSLIGFSPVSLRCVSVALTCLLLLHSLPSALQAQVVSAPRLKILVLDGEGAINIIKLGTAREPIVQIQDENDRPVAGAMVVFTLPDHGASGIFADGTKSLIVHTDTKGQAVARGLKPNQTPGQFKIRVDVSYQGATTSSAVTQSNAVAAAAAAGGVSAKLIAILAIVGGAAAVGAVAATGGGNGTPTTVTPGRTTFGPPR